METLPRLAEQIFFGYIAIHECQSVRVTGMPTELPVSRLDDKTTSSDLVTVGYGKTKPKDPSVPMDPANRRVQVVNMDTKTASK